jgi:hypothetical protein
MWQVFRDRLFATWLCPGNPALLAIGCVVLELNGVQSEPMLTLSIFWSYLVLHFRAATSVRLIEWMPEVLAIILTSAVMTYFNDEGWLRSAVVNMIGLTFFVPRLRIPLRAGLVAMHEASRTGNSRGN